MAKKNSSLNGAQLKKFEKRVVEVLLDHFKKGKLEDLFGLIKAYSDEIPPHVFYRLAIASQIHRTTPKESSVELANIVGQLCLSPAQADGTRELRMGSFSHSPFTPCPECLGGARAPFDEKFRDGMPEYLQNMEKDLNAALWEILEQGGLWKALRDLRDEPKTPYAGPDITYQLDFRSEYVEPDKKSGDLIPRHLTVIGTISFPFQHPKEKKSPPLVPAKPGMLPCAPCKTCGGSGFGITASKKSARG